MRALALLLLLLPTAACEGGGGAVSVRWRLIDLQSGVGYDPKTYDGPDGVCRCGPVSDFVRTESPSVEMFLAEPAKCISDLAELW